MTEKSVKIPVVTIKLTGLTPMLHHRDNIEWSDLMEKWRKDPNNKKLGKAGDDRTPAWTWIGSLNHDNQRVAIPSDNLMACMRDGGTLVSDPMGKRGKSLKSETQSGFQVLEAFWPMLVNGREIPYKEIEPLLQEDDFTQHQQRCSALGFQLFIKRARIGTAKHVRVRPQFDNWTATGRIAITLPKLNPDILLQILNQAGLYKGLGDWRPGAKTPGAFGQFKAEIISVE
jgi:hypothetical protein